MLPGYSGSAVDFLINSSNGRKFSTKDRDNDNNNRYHCSLIQGGEGGWWFSSCGYSNLNGGYLGSAATDYNGIGWYHAYNDHIMSVKVTEMKVRPI